MKDIGEELRELGDAAAISLGFIVIEIAVFLAIALIMRAIYCRPHEEHSEAPSYGTSYGSGVPVHLIANPVNRGCPFSVYHK